MKQFYSIIMLAFLLGSCNLMAQENNVWSLEAGVNYVNVYSVGGDAPQGEFFDEFFNVNDHWNLGTYIAVTRNFSDRLSLTARASFNEITKWGQFGDNDVSAIVDNLEYYGLDGMVNFKILKDTRIQPYVALGGGYTWIEEGKYNTYSLEEADDDFVGAGTVNGALGFTVAITDHFGANFQSAYKHSFKEYLTKHWQHSIGLTYALGKSSKVANIVEPLDTDKDGIIDEYDVCPTVFGLKVYAGCPDADGDGIPDSLDKCPKVKGLVSNEGCPLEDTDGDSVADVDDKCPNIAGTAANNGCPDTDKDGVIDLEDQCPNTAGTISNNGCPLVVAPSTQVINDLNNYAKTILFDTSKSSFQQRTYSVLQAITAILKEYPATNFSIQGHTDSVGSGNSNQSLSDKRANAVKDYLVANGIDTSRLSAYGFGEDYPIDSNTTKEGRKNNRRVEIKIKNN